MLVFVDVFVILELEKYIMSVRLGWWLEESVSVIVGFDCF